MTPSDKCSPYENSYLQSDYDMKTFTNNLTRILCTSFIMFNNNATRWFDQIILSMAMIAALAAPLNVLFHNSYAWFGTEAYEVHCQDSPWYLWSLSLTGWFKTTSCNALTKAVGHLLLFGSQFWFVYWQHSLCWHHLQCHLLTSGVIFLRNAILIHLLTTH
jgi:hypothetical protein